jgi:hypothetical protein
MLVGNFPKEEDMSGPKTGILFFVALAWTAAGCAESEPSDGPFSQCRVYEADGMMYMECPVSALARQAPDPAPSKHSPIDRVEHPLRACPPSQCHQDFCWSLCEVEGDLCIYSARPPDRSNPSPRPKTEPATWLPS